MPRTERKRRDTENRKGNVEIPRTEKGNVEPKGKRRTESRKRNVEPKGDVERTSAWETWRTVIEMSGTGLSLGEPCWSWRSCDSSNWCRRMYQSIENLGNRRLDGSSLILEGQGQRRCVISKNDEGSFEISEPPGWRRWSHARCRSTQSVYLTCLWLFQQTMGLMKLRRANSTHSVMQLGAELSGEQAKTQNTK